jgi:hypothetical protein
MKFFSSENFPEKSGRTGKNIFFPQKDLKERNGEGKKF